MLRIVKNNLVSHCDQRGNQHSIYSIDFQSNGNRLASGGGGLFYFNYFNYYFI